nr:protein FAR1-related sequence 5-like [Tanacetum cinerariifolium]GEW05674.1 protein FAR1-related sequence 5-like [Tanacetum cinerariifolium]
MVKTLGIVRVTDDGVKSYKPNVPDSVKPLKGKLFNTLEDALHFYRTYAKLSGFEAQKSTEYKRKDGKIKQKYFVCSRKGLKPIAIMDTLVDNFENLEIKKAKRKRKRPSCRCGCLAHVILDITAENKYVVCSFDEEHNHPFVDEDDMSLLKSLRKLTFFKKQVLFRVSNNNIGPMKAFMMMTELFGGFNEVGATSIIEYINGFSCDYFTNDDGNLSGLFWADEVAKHNYLSYDDVISFDATFCSNKTLAAALLSNETSELYRWLLRAFKKAFGREPMFVVTDRDPTMKIVVEKEFSNSRHRLCMWHIMEKLSTKVLFTHSDVTLSCSCKRFERRWTRDAVTREKQTGFNGRNKFSDGSIRDEIIEDIIGSAEYWIDKLASNIEELAIFRDRLQDLKSKVDTNLPN